MFTGNSLQIGNLSRLQMASIAENLLNINVSYTMDMANQLSFSVIDPGFVMANNNYFQVGVDVVYETTSIEKISIIGDQSPIVSRIKHLYEISNVSVSQQNSASPVWSIEAMPKAVQQMKRDKKPGSISGDGYTYVQRAAKKYGLKFVGEKSSRIKHSSKNSGDNQSDSVWTIIKKIADDSQYMLFVQDGCLYFGTQKWLLYKWGTNVIKGRQKKDKKGKPIINSKTKKPEVYPNKYFIPMEYRGYTENPSVFEVMSLPQISKNENDPMEASGSLTVSRRNGVQLRPGMTIRINNIPNMDGYYLITAVNFSEQTTDPVGIEFRTPERLRTEDGKEPKIDLLPIGRIFRSDMVPSRPIFGASAVGEVSRAELSPIGQATGSTIESFGDRTSIRIPNSRRPDIYPDIVDMFESKRLMQYLPSGMNISQVKSILAPATLIASGNMDLYNRPLMIISGTTGKRVVTSLLHVYEDIIIGNFVLCERVQCSGGIGTLLTPEESEIFYMTTGIHCGIWSTEKSAKLYKQVMEKYHQEILKKRFPKSYKKIIKGDISSVIDQLGVCPVG